VIEAVLAFFLVTVRTQHRGCGRAGNLAPLAIGMTLTLNIIMVEPDGRRLQPGAGAGPDGATGNFSDGLACTCQRRSLAPSSLPFCTPASSGSRTRGVAAAAQTPARMNPIRGICFKVGVNGAAAHRQQHGGRLKSAKAGNHAVGLARPIHPPMSLYSAYSAPPRKRLR